MTEGRNDSGCISKVARAMNRNVPSESEDASKIGVGSLVPPLQANLVRVQRQRLQAEVLEEGRNESDGAADQVVLGGVLFV